MRTIKTKRRAAAVAKTGMTRGSGIRIFDPFFEYSATSLCWSLPVLKGKFPDKRRILIHDDGKALPPCQRLPLNPEKTAMSLSRAVRGSTMVAVTGDGVVVAPRPSLLLSQC